MEPMLPLRKTINQLAFVKHYDQYKCSKCGTLLEIILGGHDQPAIQQKLQEGGRVLHMDIELLLHPKICLIDNNPNKAFCNGWFVHFGTRKEEKYLEVQIKTAYGYAVERAKEIHKAYPNFDHDMSKVCCALLLIPPHTPYHGDSGLYTRGEKITNPRLRDLLKTVKKEEPWEVENCAEVQAAQHLLNQHPDIKKEHVEFAACNIKGIYAPPCKNCKQWIYRL